MSNTQNIEVVVRVRPLTESEIEQNVTSCVQVHKKSNEIFVVRKGQNEAYRFDHVFDGDDCQVDVYSRIVYPIVEEVFNGFNGCVMAYGQTGSGKTYTISGKEDPPSNRGLLPLAFQHIFSKISQSKGKFLVNVSYLEIYNDEVYDLLVNKKNNLQKDSLEIRESPEQGIYVNKLTGYLVESLEEVYALLLHGNKCRVTAATNSNLESSRSHTIFSIYVECASLADNEYTFGKLSFVDLAGSERQKKANTVGLRFKEATKINLALSALSNVISILADGRSDYVPYRSSKLTRLLKDSLGGNSKTVMIANISPSENDFNESCSTLRYANRTKFIKNCVSQNKSQKRCLLKQLEDEIAYLKKQLESLNLDDGVGGDDEGDNSDDIEDVSQVDNLKEIEPKQPPPRSNHIELSLQLKNLSSKLLIGGEKDVLNKSIDQHKLLKNTEEAIEKMDKFQQKLAEWSKESNQKILTMNSKYASLQEEMAAKRCQFKEVWKLTNNALRQLDEIEKANEKDLQDFHENMSRIQEATDLADEVINRNITKECLNKIIAHCVWNENVNDWMLNGMACTANNIKIQKHCSENDKSKLATVTDCYKTYRWNLDENKSEIRYASLIPTLKKKRQIH